MREVLCLCSLAPELSLETRITVLMHWREAATTSNSARLAAVALKNCEIHVRPNGEESRSASALLRPDATPLLLFPSADSIELGPELLSKIARPIQLIVPDGTWRQARKVTTRIKEFAGIPKIRLPAGGRSVYQLRQSPHEQNLSTFEAIARALGIIEGPAVQEKLEALFEIMVERSLWSRGKLQIRDCKHPIPQAAFDAFHKDGCAGTPLLKRY